MSLTPLRVKGLHASHEVISRELAAGSGMANLRERGLGFRVTLAPVISP